MDLEKEIEQIVKQVIEDEIRPYLERIEAFEDGKDGEDYILTDEDKKEIASSITVPIVEKVIERREVIKEQPIIKTEVVKEVVKEVIKEVRNDDATIDYLEDKISTVDKDFKKTVAEITKKMYIGVGGIKDIRAGTNVTIDNTNLQYPVINATGGTGDVAWGDITGTLSDQTDLQTALDGKVDENVAITGATKTKITYDAKGLITAGADATTADIADSSNKRYVTDAQLTVIGNTSGTNTGDNATNTQYSGLAASKQDTLVSGTNIKTINGSTLLGSGDLTVGGGVSDGDKGDITVSGTGATWTIDNGAVTLAKQADMATASVVYRKTAGSGAPEVQTLSTLKTDLGLTGTNSGDQTSIVGITGTKAQFDTAVTDGNFLYVGDVTTNATHTGEVTGSGALTVDKTAISNRTDTVITASDYILFGDATDTDNLKKDTIQGILDLVPASATDLTYTAATRVLASSTGTDATLPLVSSGDAGLAPASGGGTSNFLRADGTWTAPTASATITTQDEGGTLSSSVTTLNFTGAGVTATGAGATTTIDIPGGSGSGLTYGQAIVTSRAYLKM